MKSNKINKKRLKSIISEEFNKLSEDEMNEFLGMLPGSSKRKMADMIKKQNSESESGVTPEERSFMFDAAVQMVFADGVINILNKSKDPDVKRFVRFLQGSDITEAEIGSQRRRNKPAGSSTGTTPEIAKAQAQSLQKAMKNTSLATGVWKALHLVKDLPSMREYMRGSIARKWLEKTASEWGASPAAAAAKPAEEPAAAPTAAPADNAETPAAAAAEPETPAAAAEPEAAATATPEPGSIGTFIDKYVIGPMWKELSSQFKGKLGKELASDAQQKLKNVKSDIEKFISQRLGTFQKTLKEDKTKIPPLIMELRKIAKKRIISELQLNK